ncbi:hypothetical protein ER308_16675 [Egibacter rhizosphaerae]|uniref:Uncharacterized protein n=1 Tax=Egibacter rhizosphaerae TaxID=1670831 RepID=A0A411YIA8_9ACTN|nr:hypothetical protein [Egibacter rhizosphaerae]QBI21045.1 hypothetical protein ER308_16675 [Egibacter rhizosphaerae]
MGSIIMAPLGLVAYIHFLVTMLATDSLGWAIAGTLGFPVVSVLWPVVAFFSGMLAGFYAVLFYAAMGFGLWLNAQTHG